MNLSAAFGTSTTSATCVTVISAVAVIPGLEQSLGVIHGEHRLIGHDATRRFRRATDFADLRRERTIRIRIDTEVRGLSHADVADVGFVDVDDQPHLGEVLRKCEQRRGLKRGRHRLAWIDLPVQDDAADRRADDGFLDVSFDGGRGWPVIARPARPNLPDRRARA